MGKHELYVIQSNIDGQYSVIDPKRNFAAVARNSSEQIAMDICKALNLYWKRLEDDDVAPTRDHARNDRDAGTRAR
jgi:hypothetical protein